MESNNPASVWTTTPTTPTEPATAPTTEPARVGVPPEATPPAPVMTFPVSVIDYSAPPYSGAYANVTPTKRRQFVVDFENRVIHLPGDRGHIETMRLSELQDFADWLKAELYGRKASEPSPSPAHPSEPPAG